MPFQIVQEKITKLEVEAVVSSDDSQLSHSEGVSWAIAQAAGEGRIKRFAKQHTPLELTQVAVSPGYHLKAEYIIHASVPTVNETDVEILLSRTYQNIFKEVDRLAVHSIALPLLSAGQYGLPKDLLMQIALHEIRTFLKNASDTEVFLTLPNHDIDRIPYEIYEDLKDYLEENHQTEVSLYEALEKRRIEEKASYDFTEREERQGKVSHSFRVKLLQKLETCGIDDLEFCYKANITRKIFSEIRASETYKPKKTIVFACVIALKCSLEESEEWLNTIGYSFDASDRTDVIMEYFIINELYDILTINQTLYELGESQLIYTDNLQSYK